MTKSVEHQMLISYDGVLAAIREKLNRAPDRHDKAGNRAA
jgi:hypothetical protein